MKLVYKLDNGSIQDTGMSCTHHHILVNVSILAIIFHITLAWYYLY